MPTLDWIGKEKVINHHRDVPYRVLEHQYGFDGENGESKDPTNSGNKIIHGDNLEALKSLLPEYEGKIKCIYIDPPYNTGNEGWVYNDNVNHPKIKKWLGEVVGKEGDDLSRHDKWLCMMYPRLKLLHKLLADDGAIFVSIDDSEQASLKLLLDEIFGIRNFIGNVIWQKKYTRSNDAKYFSDTHDFISVFCKNKKNFVIGRLPRTEKQNNRYTNPDNHPKGPWKATPLHAKSGSDKVEDFEYEFKNGIKWSPPEGTYPRFSDETLREYDKNDEIWFGMDGTAIPSRKTFLSELKNSGNVPMTIWLHNEVGSNHEARTEVKDIFNGNPFDSPKPSSLIENVLRVGNVKENEIILDSFAGSGTTAHSVQNLNAEDGGNRKFILIEMEEYANSITAERVKRVISGYGKGKKKVEGRGGSFNYYELGEPLFNENDLLNEEVEEEKIREYVWYSETKSTFSGLKKHPHLLGSKDGTSYYFYYKKESLTTLDHDFLETIEEKAEQYVIYADNCLLSKKFMQEHSIVFKKIPRDISRF